MFCVSCRGHHISAGQGQFLQEPFPIRGDLTLRPSEDLAGFIVRLEDDMETMLGDLLIHWDETTVGLLDYDPS